MKRALKTTTTTVTTATAAKPNRRERRMVRYWRVLTPNKRQPQTSECRCGVAFAARKTRDAIKARQQHERQTGHGR